MLWSESLRSQFSPILKHKQTFFFFFFALCSNAVVPIKVGSECVYIHLSSFNIIGKLFCFVLFWFLSFEFPLQKGAKKAKEDSQTFTK